MTIPFAPMYVKYQHREHYVFALLPEAPPSSFNVKRSGNDYDKEIFAKLESVGNVGPMFMGYETGGIEKKIVTIPARDCEFERLGDRCVMCGAEKEGR